MPPTLAPLGADSSELAEDAGVPVTIGEEVQATATNSTLDIEATTDDSETLPTSQPVDLSSDISDSSESLEEEASVQPESFVPPTAEQASASEPVIVSVTTDEELPSGGPIAVNPPASDTSGDYVASAPAAAPISGDGFPYIVENGDTLFGLSLAYGTTVSAIMQANGLNSEMIYEGQTLTIPSDGQGGYNVPAYAPTYPGGGGEYIVTTGDTLFSIGLRYGSSVEAIAAANGIVPPYFIYPGQSLTIPAYSDSTYVADTMATHTVTSGETLFFIAQQYGVTTQSLVAANGLAHPNQIRVGQTLNIPY
jgi:LysM repeat protein